MPGRQSKAKLGLFARLRSRPGGIFLNQGGEGDKELLLRGMLMRCYILSCQSLFFMKKFVPWNFAPLSGSVIIENIPTLSANLETDGWMLFTTKRADRSNFFSLQIILVSDVACSGHNLPPDWNRVSKLAKSKYVGTNSTCSAGPASLSS